jgi:hypothetical protein
MALTLSEIEAVTNDTSPPPTAGPWTSISAAPFSWIFS